MAMTLAVILGNLVKQKGGDLTQARKDLKDYRSTLAGIKASRKLIASHLRVLKAQRLEIDRKGGGDQSAYINAEINFMRQVYNDLTEESTMVDWKRKSCGLFIKGLYDEVKAVDAEWEKAKAAEAAEAETVEVADETPTAE